MTVSSLGISSKSSALENDAVQIYKAFCGDSSAIGEGQMKRIFLHIGTHKTGSTSLQRWLREHENLLLDNGYRLFHSQHTRDNHVELYLASMRYERDSFAKQSMTDIKFDENYTAMVSGRVKEFLSSSEQEKAIFTTEGLSLLRHKDELQRLGEILADESASITIIVFLRDASDYLTSYRAQLLRKIGRKPSRDYWSALYVEDDTWLTDYEGLLDAYSSEFGHDSVQVIDYDEQMRSKGNIIPAFLDAIELDENVVNERSLESYRDNQTPPVRKRRSLRSLVRSLARKLRIGLRR